MTPPRFLRVSLFCLLAGLLAPPGLGRSASLRQEPWALAVVLESGEGMTRPWQGTTRLEALEPLLTLELRTLPLRVRAALWAAGSGGPRLVVDPNPARKLKGLSLTLPREKGTPPLAPALARAAAWVKKEGGGAVLLITSGKIRDLGGLGRTDWGEGVFCQVLAMDPGEAPGLLALAQAGGGVFLTARRRSTLAGLLHHGVKTGLSASRLVISAYDPKNRALALDFGLKLTVDPRPRIRGRSGRVMQLLPAAYRLIWPRDSGAGPGGPPKTVSLNPGSVTSLEVGGTGKLEVEARDKDGRAQAWALKVVRLTEGEIIHRAKKTPFALNLASGRYSLRSLRHPLVWEANLGAGKNLNLTVGPPARLLVKIAGPEGPLRVPFRVFNLIAGKKESLAHTQALVRLLPGRYRLEVMIPPGMSRTVEIKPGGRPSLQLPPAGGLLVAKSRGRMPSYQVLGPKGVRLVGGVGGRVVHLLPGEYSLAFGAGKALRPISISPGRLTTIQPAP